MGEPGNRPSPTDTLLLDPNFIVALNVTLPLAAVHVMAPNCELLVSCMSRSSRWSMVESEMGVITLPTPFNCIPAWRP